MRPKVAVVDLHSLPNKGLATVLSPISVPEFPRQFFDFFGLERKLSIDEAHLQKRFYELSKEWHPDRWSRKSAQEQAQALEATAILNDGYRTLRDPVKRAEYLLTEEGFPIGEQRSKDVPPELLEEVFELNMALEELRGGEESARPQLEAAKDTFLGMRGEIDRELTTLFAKYDAAESESETAKQALHDIRGVLNRRRYIENLLRDVDKALNPATAAEPLENRL
jgi:molecular chaperone HscB